jgi:hypothetical protein
MHAFPTAGLLALALSAADACAQQGGAEGASTGRTGRFELKRMNTARGTPDETTMTQLRMERYFDGPVAMLRFDLPLPDEKTGFAGDPFEPRLGDVKLRLRLRDLKSGALSFPPFVEAIFPTADPKSLGKGKYQLSAGIRMIAPMHFPFGDSAAHRSTFEFEVQQTNSVAGDPAAKEVSNTRFEISIFDLWREKYLFKLKLKPNIDWTLDGKSGGVVEAEAGRYVGNNWRVWVMLGQRAWGPSNIANTYKTRVELGLNYTY